MCSYGPCYTLARLHESCHLDMVDGADKGEGSIIVGIPIGACL